MQEGTFSGARIQLTPYDLLGYLTPGATMMISIFVFEYLVEAQLGHVSGASELHAPLLESATRLFRVTLASQSSVGVLAVFTVLAAIAYVVGHVVASVSALLLDRTLVYKGYGYPSSNLLQLERINSAEREFSGSYYRGTFFWLSTVLILDYTGRFVTPNASIPLSPLAYSITIYVAVATMAKLVVSSSDFKRRRPGFFISRGARVMRYAFSGVVDVLSRPVSSIMDTKRSFDHEFLTMYQDAFRNAFSLEVETAGTNNFWLTYCYVLEKTSNLRSLASFWRTMYTFARNLAAAFFLSFVYCFLWLLVHLPVIGDRGGVFPYYLPLTYFACACILLLRYYYLYVCYFNKFIFRAFVFSEQARRWPSPSRDAEQGVSA